MNKWSKVVFLISMLFNVIFISISLLIIVDKGGFEFIKRNINILREEPSSQWVQRLELFQSIEHSEIDKIFVGDSMTQLGEFNEYFPGEVVINRGIANDTSKGVLSRINEIANRNAEKVYLMIGINDIKNEKNSLSEYSITMRKIIISLKNGKSKNIYVQSILPTQEEVLNKKIMEFNQELEVIASELDVEYVNLYRQFLNKKGELIDNYTYDGVHLTGEGYNKWIEIIKGNMNSDSEHTVQ